MQCQKALETIFPLKFDDVVSFICCFWPFACHTSLQLFKDFTEIRWKSFLVFKTHETNKILIHHCFSENNEPKIKWQIFANVYNIFFCEFHNEYAHFLSNIDFS